jgi:hypothetical protein
MRAPTKGIVREGYLRRFGDRAVAPGLSLPVFDSAFGLRVGHQERRRIKLADEGVWLKEARPYRGPAEHWAGRADQCCFRFQQANAEHPPSGPGPLFAAYNASG